MQIRQNLLGASHAFKSLFPAFADVWESMLGDKDWDFASFLAIWLDAKNKIKATFGGGAI
jgi:hypothetical protein